MRIRLAGLCVIVLIVCGGCGGGGESLTEYVERINGIQSRAMAQYLDLVASPRGEVLVVESSRLTDFTTQDLHEAMERVAVIQAEALTDANAVEPPEQVAELHDLFFRELPIAELAARAGTAADWYELSASNEMAAYRTALAGDIEVCAEFEAKLDATAERGAFVDTPWIPGELKEIVEFAIGCSSLPESPEDLFRPPPTTIP